MFMVKTNSKALAASDRFDRRLKIIYTVLCIITLICEVVLNATKFNLFFSIILSILPVVIIYMTWQITTGQMVTIVQNPIYKDLKIVKKMYVAPILIAYRIILEIVLALRHDISWICLAIIIILEIAVIVFSFVLDEMYELHDDVLTVNWARKLRDPEKYEFKDVSDKAINTLLGLDVHEHQEDNEFN